MTTKLCDVCEATGLAAHVALYLPVPAQLGLGLPAWAGAERVRDVDIGPEFRYALRNVRAGFIYAFFSKNAWGSSRWQAWAVGRQGQLYPMADPQWVIGPDLANAQCKRSGHTAARLHHLVIERPEKCGTTWVAFSDHQWNAETLKRYGSDEKLRNERMQRIEPAQIIASDAPSGAHYTAGSAAALEAIVEYAPGFGPAQLPHDGAPSDISTGEDGGYHAQRLQRCSTRYPWDPRAGQAQSSAELMRLRSKKPDGTPHPGIVLALWDPVGTTLELNGWRNEAAGRIEQHGQERALQITAANAVEGLEQALQQHIDSRWDQAVNNRGRLPDPEENGMRTRALQGQAKGDPAALAKPLYELDESFKSGQTGEAAYKAQRSHLFQQQGRNPAALEADYARIDAHRERRANTRAAHLQRNKAGDLAREWAKYEARIDKPALAAFNEKRRRFFEAAERLVDARTEPLIRWLEAPLFIASLEDFDPQDVVDGVAFNDRVGEALFGINSSPAGRKKLDAWVAEAKASSKGNLVWRTVALNQAQGVHELDAALQEALRHKAERTLAGALEWSGYTAKLLKGLADTYKKAQGVFDANTKAGAAAGLQVFSAPVAPVNTHQADKFAITVGDAVFRHFRLEGLSDRASEKIVQHIFSVRAFVEPADSVNLIVAQARHAGLARGQTLERLRTARSFLAADVPQLATAQTEALKAAWAEFQAKGGSGAASAVKDARLAVVVGLIEGVNFFKLVGDCATKGDAKSWWTLSASGMAIGAALLDVATVPAKNLFGSESWSYQKLKLFGGVLSAAAGGIGVWWDGVDAGRNFEKGHYGLLGAHFLKGALGAASAGLTAATTFTYAAPLIARLTGRAAVGTAVRAVGARAAAVVGARILFMSAGAWITVGMVGLQGLIWIIEDNALEDWVVHCAFGQKFGTGGYATVKQQDEALLKALLGVGLVQ